MYYLSKKEFDIMNVLWNSSQSLTANQICEIDKNLIMSTTQVSLRKLLKNKFISVDQVVMNNKSLSRSYIPIVKQGEYILNSFNNIDVKRFMVSLLNHQNINKEEYSKLRELLENNYELDE